jgi:hypothetical protein
MRKLFLAAATLALALCAPEQLEAQGQFVSLSTVAATLASATTCTGSPQLFITSQGIPNFRNLGQTSHLATATSTAAQFQMEIDGIDSLGNVFRLSDLQLGVPSSARGGLVVTASGYMTNIQVAVTCSAGATFSVSYSGSFSPQPPNIGGSLLAAVEKLPFQIAAANATSATTFQTPNGNSQGTIVFQYSGTGPANSTITAQCITNSGTNLTAFSFMLNTAATAQLFTVTQATCPFVTLTYTAGGASAVTYNLEYVFNAQATQQTLASSNSGPSSTSPLQVVADAIGQAFYATEGTAGTGFLFTVSAHNGARSLYFDRLYISCTATCTFNLNKTNDEGTTCTTSGPGGNTKFGTAQPSTSLTIIACTIIPSGGSIFNQFTLPANTTTFIDLKGFIAPSGTTTGIGMTVSANTGNISTTLLWYEK